MLHVTDILVRAVRMGASDVHLTVNRPPVFRVNGRLTYDEKEEPLTTEEAARLVLELLPGPAAREALEQEGQVDFSNSFAGAGRVRVNAYRQRGSHGAAIRFIPFEVPRIDSLGLPRIASELALKERGLVLVTGITGSGKSTTLAAMLDLINRTRSCHILTLEDPIEYLHRHNKSIINQREIGNDSVSFATALRAALRQDPDVILVGEMRDLETIATAVTAAETGHLVLASLHSGSAAQTIDRIIDVFPPHQQAQIRVQLAATLQGIITQQLIPRADGKGRVLAVEVLVATPAVRNLIREGKGHQIYSALQTGSAAGMITMERSLKRLVETGVISMEEAAKRASNNDNIQA